MFFINDDIAADRAIEELKELEEMRNRLERVTKARIEEIQANSNQKIEQLKSEEESLRLQLHAYAQTISEEMKHTKTQAKYILPTGTIVIKKPKKDFIANKDALLAWAIKNDKTIIKEKVTQSLDWSALKKDLIISDDGQVIRKSTGEILEGEIVYIEESKERLEVKY